MCDENPSETYTILPLFPGKQLENYWDRYLRNVTHKFQKCLLYILTIISLYTCHLSHAFNIFASVCGRSQKSNLTTPVKKTIKMKINSYSNALHSVQRYTNDNLSIRVSLKKGFDDHNGPTRSLYKRRKTYQYAMRVVCLFSKFG